MNFYYTRRERERERERGRECVCAHERVRERERWREKKTTTNKQTDRQKVVNGQRERCVHQANKHIYVHTVLNEYCSVLPNKGGSSQYI